MTIRRAALYEFELPLHRPLSTAHGAIKSRRGWLVELETDSGQRGFGEATPLPDFGTEDLVVCRAALERSLTQLLGTQPGAPFDESPLTTSLLVEGAHAAEPAPCASTAVETALFDLAARQLGRTLAQTLRSKAALPGDPEPHVITQALVGGDAPSQVFASAKRATAEGFEAFKLKLAVSPQGRDADRDVDRVAALREAVGPGLRLRLDANEAWSEEEARRAMQRIEPFEIDYIEQPVPRADLVGLANLSQEAPIAVAADEALQGPGLLACLEARAAEILVVKPAALGGIARSIALSLRARDEGLQLVWSTLLDGAVGRSVPLALAAGLGSDGEVHGLGTASLLAADLFGSSEGEGMLADGRLRPASAPGIGFDPEVPLLAGQKGERTTPVFEVGP